jgi:hypothetical protein
MIAWGFVVEEQNERPIRTVTEKLETVLGALGISVMRVFTIKSHAE